MANNVVEITHKLVIICARVTPTFLAKNPATIDPNNGKVIYLCVLVL